MNSPTERESEQPGEESLLQDQNDRAAVGEASPGDLADDGNSGALVVVEEDSAMPANPALAFPVVGIGGSAGSLEVLTELFKKLSPKTGMAFVVVLHLLPNQESHLAGILARHTSMPVTVIEDGTLPEPNHVYVLGPNVRVVLRGDRLQLEPRANASPFLPVNDLFQSMALAQKGSTVGVVLSGMDGDGALGLRALKGEGGFAIVQTPESARFAGMPLSSINGDHVDLILPPEELAANLATLGQRFQAGFLERLETGQPSPEEQRESARILKLLKGVSGVDFRLYKQTTVQRRIARRMVMHKLDTMTDYLALLQGNGRELQALQEDILINVTRFFRDPEVFEALKNTVLPQILGGREPDQQVRVWVAGCATGEEVYSLAMCLLEQLPGIVAEPSVQIFGTDASEQNVQTARLGVYPESVVNEVSAERLRRFFTRTEKGYQINKRVRDLCIFARQNLCTDPPFSRLDLVSCRNVLIYFGSELQQRVISTFHYALRPEGFLLLGSSESIREFTDMFTVVDRFHKFFSKMEGSSHRTLHASFAPHSLADRAIEIFASPLGDLRKDADLGRLADRTILARYGPPGVVVNSKMEILQIRGRTSPFLEMAPGVASLQLSRMLKQGIAPEVVSAVSRAIQSGLPVELDPLQLVVDEQTVEARVEVLPMPTGEPGMELRHFLVAFLPSTRSLQPLPLPAAVPQEQARLPDPTITQLQHDLASSKLYLNSLLDEREATNQELISANEEIQSSNEELQSTNEELETTKEELQSANEELQTVNDELEDRNAVLTQASNDLTNLLNSVNLAVLMLSNELHIRHFTPQTQRLMNVRAQDVGRPFGDIRLNLAVEDLELRLLQVLDTLTPQEVEVQDRDGRWYFLRIRPYRTTENKIEGLVLVLVDIDQSRRSQQELRDARDFGASVIANTPLPLVVINAELRVVYMNDAFCDLAFLSRQVIEGRMITELAAGLWNMEPQLRTLLNDMNRNRTTDGSFECEYRKRDVPHTLLVHARPLQPDGERFILVTFQDVTPHKAVERLLKGKGKRLATQVSEITRELDRSREELRALTDSLMTSQEDERRRVARELHDDVSQRLALLDLECGATAQALEADPEAARQGLQRIRDRVAAISVDVRTLSHRLHPSVLEHLGPAAALESLLNEFTEHEGTLGTFFSEGLPEHIALEVATGLYRITQEALRNVVKHAGKAHVKVALYGLDGQLVLEIVDSGKGFEPAQRSTGLGFISMKERARLLGATLAIESAARRGTSIRVSVPLASATAAATS